MGKVFDLLKTELNKYKSSIQVITGFVIVLSGLTVLITKIVASRFTIAIICIGLFFIINKICREIIRSKRESFGVTAQTYSKRAITLAKFLRIANFLFLGFPIYVAGNLAFNKATVCTPSTNLGILIASFSVSRDDDFSYALYSKLESELQDNDTVSTIRLTNFIQKNGSNYTDSIRQLFKGNCFNRGLLVYGKRSEQSKLFDCNIYINNLDNLHENAERAKNKKIIYLQNPDLIHFSIDAQANMTTEFILGLLYYNSNNFLISKEKFLHSLNLNGNGDNKKFIAYCHLFIGNNLYKLEKKTDAIKEYREGISYDSLNANLHFNLASTLLSSSDSLSANKEFTVAHELNDKLINPMQLTAAALGNSNRYVVPPAVMGMPPTFKQVLPSKDPKESDKNNGVAQFNSQLTIIVKHAKYGVIDEKGDTIVACIYDYIDPYQFSYKDRKYFIVKKNDKFGALNSRGGVFMAFKRSSEEDVKSTIRMAMDSDSLTNSINF